ncbi:MAG: bifunctional hydroxymethylpyrimidine kinase/phosphomethylpyrimidine kinase [Pseudomonadota bacterium]
MIPSTLSISVCDPSVGTGMQADIRAISAGGGDALDALAAENTRGVGAVEMVSPDIIVAQITAIRADARVDAVKIGMFGDTRHVAAVVDAFGGSEPPIALDPFRVVKGGNQLLAPNAIAAPRTVLVHRAAMLTPNLLEGADLPGPQDAADLQTMQAQDERQCATISEAVLMKDDPLAGPIATVLLPTGDGVIELQAPRTGARNPHGAGATRSSTPAALTSAANPPPHDSRWAKAAITAGIAASDRLSVGGGHGPVHQFHNQDESIS